MKKRELKAKIAELEQSVHTWMSAALRASKELTRVQMVLQSIARPAEQNQAAFTKGRQCGMNVLAAIAGQPSMTVTATNDQDAPLAAVATQAVNFGLRDKPASRADKEDLYRDGLACGLSSEAAWERAKMGVEAWNAKERNPQ